MNATGRCLCGAVTFTAERVETKMHVCHCSTCRRWSSGPVFAAAVGAVVFEGDAHLARFESSPWAERGFCMRCGTSLFLRLKEADRYLISVGAFDDQAAFKVQQEIYVDEKPAGYALAGDHPRLTGAEFLRSIGRG